MKRITFNTTINEDLVEALKVRAVQKKLDVNDILEPLIEKYLQGQINIDKELKDIIANKKNK